MFSAIPRGGFGIRKVPAPSIVNRVPYVTEQRLAHPTPSMCGH